MRLVHGVQSHVGLVRHQNEDSFVALAGMWVVCDGMGGARAGEVASEAACAVMADLPAGAGAEELREAIDSANGAIRQRSQADPALSGMGTTLTAASGSGPEITIAQVGDSRAYLLHEGRLRQVTDDHSLVAEMIRRGQLTPEQAAVHPHRSIITRAIGTEESVFPDFFDLDLEVGDRLLLCSDGLSGMVPEDEIEVILGTGDEPQAVADGLVAAALDHGGEDNITVVVIFALSDDEGPSPESEAGEEDEPAPAPTIEAAGSASGPQVEQAGQAETTQPGDVRAGGSTGGRRKALLMAGAVVIVIGLAFGAFVAFNSTVYFVGTVEGQVALFQGMPYKVMGVQLYGSVETSPVSFGELDAYLQERVDSHELVTKEEGLRFIRGLQTSQ
jgi:serine/threonine protein phosphatase PrpC